MAEIYTTSANRINNKGASRRAKKLSTKVDLTPMVDLGFLLITFFIFTTTMSQSKVMELPLPNDKETTAKMPVKESESITLLLGNNHIVYYYEGIAENEQIRNCSIQQIRQVLMQKKKTTLPADLFVIIKPTNNSVYDDVVKMLNEMIVNEVKHYALVDATISDEQSIEKAISNIK